MKSDKLVTIKKYMNAYHAEVDKTVLEAAGIKSMVSSDDYGGMQPALQFSNGVRLIVREEDADRALIELSKEQDIEE